MRAWDKGERIGGEELHSQLWRGREQIRGGKREKGERGGRERDGKVPGFNFFFSFSFGWLRFNQLHLMAEKKWRHGTEGGIVEFSNNIT